MDVMKWMYTSKILTLFFFVFIFATESFASEKWDQYRVVDTVPLRNVKKKKVYKAVIKWFESEKATRIVRANPNNYTIEGKGFFIYYNHIKMEDIFLSPRIAERTNGNIVFKIKVNITDSIVITEFSNFSHEANYSPYGELSFGIITDYVSTPPGKCMENKLWCDAVWKDLKEKSRAEVLARVSRILPSSMIRRVGEVYIPDEKEESDTTKKEVDRLDYLKLENYLENE